MYKKVIIFTLAFFFLGSISLQRVSAQVGMMGNYAGQPTPTQSELKDEQNMQNAGKEIYKNLQNKKITCQNLTSDNYEKLGEYFMGQAAGSIQNHAYWDQRLQQMMGDNGDTQMHIIWGERGSGCLTNAALPSNTSTFIGRMMNSQSVTKGGGFSMMGWYGGNGLGMMNGFNGYENIMGAGWSWGFALIHMLFGLIIFIDLIFLGIFLWKKIKK